MSSKVVRAAGGLVFRRTAKGNLKVLVAHRPRYDDWSFPKGKTDKGETPEQTAVREVREETGLNCRIVAPLGPTRYRIPGAIKEVNWYAMRPLPDSKRFRKNDEVDALKWLSRKSAKKTLDYERDQELLGSADLKRIAQTGTLHLLRHAAAGDRTKWTGDDRERPLTKKGRKQAAVLTRGFASLEIERIVTSPFARCVETVTPLAEAIGAEVELSDALAEGPDIDAAYDLIDSLVGNNAVICSHGDVIPATINRMMWAGLSLESRFYCSKGSSWAIDVEGGKFMTGTYSPPPQFA